MCIKRHLQQGALSAFSEITLARPLILRGSTVGNTVFQARTVRLTQTTYASSAYLGPRYQRCELSKADANYRRQMRVSTSSSEEN
jgi:hypothetical protein